jgi:hypothetical protein
MERTLLFTVGVIATMTVAYSCGGTAVVDGNNPNAGGGNNAGGGVQPSSSTGQYMVCSTPDLQGQQFDCGGGTSGVGAGQPVQCESRLCVNQHEWWSQCQGQGCVCYLDGMVQCSCVLEGAGQFCDGSTPSCCPEPFPQL